MDTLRETIELPDWLADFCEKRRGQAFTSDAARMELAIELARQNVASTTGGPFGAAIFEEPTGRLVSAGVNLVVGQGTSLAHAEAVGILLAQRREGTFDLAAAPARRYSLYASGQPCIMCFGVLWWSGITKLAYAARAADIESIAGFREGPLPKDWRQLLADRDGLPPIEVTGDLLREEGCQVLREYVRAGGTVYNPGSMDR